MTENPLLNVGFRVPFDQIKPEHAEGAVDQLLAEAGERPVPAWLEVIPNRMRILVHSLPARQVIDTPVQEQLIVELYSK